MGEEGSMEGVYKKKITEMESSSKEVRTSEVSHVKGHQVIVTAASW